MPCTNVTVQGPQVQGASVTITSKSGGVNQATITYSIDNPNSVSVNVSLEWTVDGSRVKTETVTGVPPEGVSGRQAVIRDFNVSAGSSRTFNICVNETNTTTA